MMANTLHCKWRYGRKCIQFPLFDTETGDAVVNSELMGIKKLYM